MCAQRRTATKRDATATAEAPASRRSSTPPRAAQPAPAGQRPNRTATKTKAEEPSRPNPFAQRTEGLRRLIRDTRAEMSKITWPDQLTTRNLTLVVIAVSTVLGLLLGGIDYVLLKLLEAL